MGLTKQYLRFAPCGVFNVVGSSKANVVYLDVRGGRGKYCAVAACEHVVVWDIRKGEKVFTLSGDKHEVTILARSPNKRTLAVGYSDGTIRIFDLLSWECTINFSGHKSAVSALNYDRSGARLVSGSKDTDVIVWDIVNECGLYRLKGHKGMVTQARFLASRNVLVTSAKDTFVKFWDLDTQHCFKTLVGHRSEVWDFTILRDETRLVTGSSDSELRTWEIRYKDETQDTGAQPLKKARLETEEEDEEDQEEDGPVACTKLGSLMRQGRDRLVSMIADPTGRIFGCHGPDSHLEVFKVATAEELKKTVQKRQKKARRKAKEAEQEGSIVPSDVEVKLEDEIQRLTVAKLSSKLRAFDTYLEQDGTAKVACLLNNNTLELLHIDSKERKPEPSSVTKVTSPGHRTDVRTVCFSSDNTAILSASGEAVKVWNRATQQCIRTMMCDYALTSVFAPGDRHIIIGTKSGKLQVFDLGAGSILEEVDAHSGPVWSICLAPDKKGFVSGSADHEVKFWDFELISDEKYSTTSKRLSIVHSRTLKMAEDVLCVKFSPDYRLLAVSLLDNTVKVFFTDTLKFFLSLYGHKLPVLCMDISSDSKLLVTGSADRNVKLWGLDFGDCHKSIFAHDDSIMCVQFVPRTHMFFTAGKDKKLKEWDGDIFEHIITLEGHLAEIWCLAISPSGNFVVTGSHDKSLRLWEKTQEPLILEEEREMEREKEYEESVAQGEEPVIAGETSTEAGLAGKKTVETVKAAERLMEALELHKEETSKLAQHWAECKSSGKELPPPPLHPMMMAYGVSTPDKYVLHVVKKIRSSELEESLLVLPFSYVMDLLLILNTFVENSWEVELSCRCLFFLLRVHQGQITSNQVLLPVIDKLRQNTSSQVAQLRDTVGFNLAGLQHLKQQLEERDKVEFFTDATDRFRERKKKEKKRALLTIKS